MAEYLVTGAAGFVGSKLANKLINDGHHVTSIDDLSTGSISNVPEGVNFIQADCSDPHIYKSLENKSFEAVFHIAGQSSGEISFEDPIKDLKSNTQSTLLLLSLCKKINCKRFIFASSMSVYGLNNAEHVSEQSKCTPQSFYAVGKLASENYLNIYKKYGINSTALRLFNIYGPGQNMLNLKQGMLSIYLAQFIDKEKVIVKGSGERFRDLIFIDDVIESILRCTDNTDSYNEAINIGIGKKITVQNIIDSIRSNLKSSKTVEFVEGTPGDLHGITACTKKMDKILGKWDKVGLEQGLRSMIEHLS
ncbi:MAG: hypothetical protein CMD35_01290 [Flavobacteriales bacterium]|nr:hypothetical protein [Flavobacteriales bacterium]